TLTYQVIKAGTAEPIYEVTKSSRSWSIPEFKYTTDYTWGTCYIRAVDEDGNRIGSPDATMCWHRRPGGRRASPGRRGCPERRRFGRAAGRSVPRAPGESAHYRGPRVPARSCSVPGRLRRSRLSGLPARCPTARRVLGPAWCEARTLIGHQSSCSC